MISKPYNHVNINICANIAFGKAILATSIVGFTAKLSVNS